MLLQQLFRSFQEVTISYFFGETNLISPFKHQGGIQKKPREKGSQETIVTAEASGLVSRKKIAYSDFLKTGLDLVF